MTQGSSEGASSEAAQPTGSEPWEQVAGEVARLDEGHKRRGRALTALKALSAPDAFDDLDKLRRRMGKLREALDDGVGKELGVGPLVKSLDEWLAGAAQKRRKAVGKELKEACEKAGLELKVVSREDPIEVRIPPLAVVLDFTSGQAELRFAKLPLRSCAAEAGEIVRAHRAATGALDAAFEPGAFFDSCWAAYAATCAALGKKRGDRVEIFEFLPHLALCLQPKKFHADPVAANWRSYPPAQVAYDVLRLRKAGALTRNGRRLNFGVATGTTAAAKNRVLYMEDENGRGEYKLTVYFTEG